MSTSDAPTGSTVTQQTTTTTVNPTVAALGGILIPLVTIVGLIVLIAMRDLEPATGIGLIGGLAGLHSGVTAARIGNGS